MNILLWILQIALALHTVMGAIWKFSNSEQTVTSLQSIPFFVWIALIVIEISCSAGLIFAGFYKPIAKLVPIAAIVIAAEMLFFCILTILSGAINDRHLIYWLVVAGVCAFVAYGRLALKPS